MKVLRKSGPQMDLNNCKSPQRLERQFRLIGKPGRITSDRASFRRRRTSKASPEVNLRAGPFGRTGEISVENRIAPEDRPMNSNPSTKLGTFVVIRRRGHRNQVRRASPASESQ